MRICGVLLAAGRGTRFGGDKLRAPIPEETFGVAAGTPLGVAAARHLVAALPDSVAVVRSDDAPLRALLAPAGLRVVECANADDGMGVSLACGVQATRDADGWIIALADMPWIAPATIALIADALREGADVAAPAHGGVRGHPVGFSRRHYDALIALVGDAGARGVIEANAPALALIDVADPAILRDVDTPGALGRQG
jgi:molybdenum cofactor cytidylyltransferase